MAGDILGSHDHHIAELKRIQALLDEVSEGARYEFEQSPPDEESVDEG